MSNLKTSSYIITDAVEGCVCKCLFKFELCENVVLHISQENGFSPVCVRIWFFKWDLLKNADPQTPQENGLSPVCVLMCLFK